MSRRSSASVLGGIGSPSGVRRPSRRSTAFFSFGLKPRMPSRTNAAFIRLTIRLCSPTRLSRSRLGRLASSSLIVGIATILEWWSSPRKEAREAGWRKSVSRGSVLGRRCLRDTATLDAWMMWASMSRGLSQRASQKPSRPASKATAMRSILCPDFFASSRQRMSSFSKVLSSTSSFFNGWRSMPGTIPATSQLERLISITAISVRSGLRGVRDRLRSFNFCMGLLSIGSHQRRRMQYPRRRPPHSIFIGGFRTTAPVQAASSRMAVIRNPSQEQTSTGANTGAAQIEHKSIAELITGRIGTRPLCFKERAKFVSPSFLVIRILLKSELQHSLDSPLRFGPRQRGLKGGDGVEEPVRGRQRNLVDETLRGGEGAPIEGGNSASEGIDEAVQIGVWERPADISVSIRGVAVEVVRAEHDFERAASAVLSWKAYRT